ncbi:hypothetical protein PRIPAC_90352 [Pristionchus pacificus]|uniref:Uncharacterized protein n=1 Tax=Pristionchus pacificus TaxID=54126 RepID=A0A2A6B7Z8_PRIPA|nr:hypothetical protein PRIPAC_90352 [Pristionchus pacificus]|eukprot:PDM62009.1 hypothetical protein PRIPAC_51451 [Pristionchus pacificus]
MTAFGVSDAVCSLVFGPLIKLDICGPNCGDRFIDDEIFLHLLRKSSGKIIIVCENGKITNAAIGAAFEMISSDMKKEEIILCVNKVATMNYRLDLKFVHSNNYVFNHNMSEFTHKNSGARGWFNEVHKGRFLIHMYSPQ